jgi:molybdopterin converting factor small subunit
MSISVLFFGATAEILRRRQIMIDETEINAAELVERLVSDHPALAMHKLLYSVNQQYASGDEIVVDGDEVAIFTAVSGG